MLGVSGWYSRRRRHATSAILLEIVGRCHLKSHRRRRHGSAEMAEPLLELTDLKEAQEERQYYRDKDRHKVRAILPHHKGILIDDRGAAV